MSYCSNCGTNIPAEAKFCPSCGTKIVIKTANQYLTGYKEKMYKNTVMALKSEGRNFAEGKAKEMFSSKFKTSESTQPIAVVFKPTKSFNKGLEEPVSSTKKFNKWTWIYVILNGFLIYLGHQSEEVIGVLLFSIIILFTVFLRRNNNKPYNWLVKIILGIQVIFLVALVVDGLAYISTITILFISLLFTNLMLLFKGNKS